MNIYKVSRTNWDGVPDYCPHVKAFICFATSEEEAKRLCPVAATWISPIKDARSKKRYRDAEWVSINDRVVELLGVASAATKSEIILVDHYAG